jgi:hypothetical protein
VTADDIGLPEVEVEVFTERLRALVFTSLAEGISADVILVGLANAVVEELAGVDDDYERSARANFLNYMISAAGMAED